MYLESGQAFRCASCIGRRLLLTEFRARLIRASPGARPSAQHGATIQSRSAAATAESRACTEGIASNEMIRPVNPHLRRDSPYWPMLAPTSKTAVGRATDKNRVSSTSSELG